MSLAASDSMLYWLGRSVPCGVLVLPRERFETVATSGQATYVCICMGSAENTFLKLLPELFALCNAKRRAETLLQDQDWFGVSRFLSIIYLEMKCITAAVACEVLFLLFSPGHTKASVLHARVIQVKHCGGQSIIAFYDAPQCYKFCGNASQWKCKSQSLAIARHVRRSDEPIFTGLLPKDHWLSISS